MSVSEDATSAQGCIFCAIVAGTAEASVVYEDEIVMAFMDRNPVTRGHLLVVPREHANGLDQVDRTSSTRVWSVGQDIARAVRRSELECEGINLLVCDCAAAFQTVFHLHLHVIPRYSGDGYRDLNAKPQERTRGLLNSDARLVRNAIAARHADRFASGGPVISSGGPGSSAPTGKALAAVEVLRGSTIRQEHLWPFELVEGIPIPVPVLPCGSENEAEHFDADAVASAFQAPSSVGLEEGPAEVPDDGRGARGIQQHQAGCSPQSAWQPLRVVALDDPLIGGHRLVVQALEIDVRALDPVCSGQVTVLVEVGHWKRAGATDGCREGRLAAVRRSQDADPLAEVDEVHQASLAGGTADDGALVHGDR